MVGILAAPDDPAAFAALFGGSQGLEMCRGMCCGGLAQFMTLWCSGKNNRESQKGDPSKGGRGLSPIADREREPGIWNDLSQLAIFYMRSKYILVINSVKIRNQTSKTCAAALSLPRGGDELHSRCCRLRLQHRDGNKSVWASLLRLLKAS